MVAIKDILLDILKYANNEFFEVIKIETNDEDTLVYSTDSENNIILNAKLNERNDNMNGVMGLGSLSYLKGLTQWEPFRGADASVNLNYQDRNGEKIPSSIVFENSSDYKATYRLMHSSAIPVIPVFKSNDAWDIEVTPTKAKIDEFAQLAALLSDMEEQLIIKVKDGNMVFYIGEESSASHRLQMTFATDVEGEFEAGLKWSIRKVLYILKLSMTGSSKFRINKKGVVNISIDSGLANYNYFVIATQK